MLIRHEKVRRATSDVLAINSRALRHDRGFCKAKGFTCFPGDAYKLLEVGFWRRALQKLAPLVKSYFV